MILRNLILNDLSRIKLFNWYKVEPICRLQFLTATYGPRNSFDVPSWTEFTKIMWNQAKFHDNLTTICVNVRDRVCLSVCYLLPDRLRYENMNGTMLSQIVRGMF